MTTYRIEKSYQWNYDHPPDPVEMDIPAVAGEWDFLGRKTKSPLGIPAGPLLNGTWILYYASLGFDVLTYKTVRSVQRDCYPMPNLVPVECNQLNGSEPFVHSGMNMDGSWAVSYGMPSKHPATWRADIEQTRDSLDKDKILSVSVVGTEQPGWTIDELADDYATCAKWAVECGADTIETNFSCPNVSSTDGQIYQQAESAAQVAERVRAAIGNTPFVIKIGHSPSDAILESLLDAVHPYIDAIATTNSVATRVQDINGEIMFEGNARGICGIASRTASVAQTESLMKLIRARNYDLKLIGVGGISTFQDVQAYLQAGAHHVQLATAAMRDPLVGVRILKNLSS